MSAISDLAPEAFVDLLQRAAIDRAWMVCDPATGQCHASHPELAPLVSFLAGPESGFAGHRAIFLAVGPESKALFGAFLHDTTRGPGQGGLRHVPFASMAAFLRDGLRLSSAMTRKSALASLWWGGGKGLIARQPGDQWRDRAWRDRLYAEYGAFVTSLRGCFVVGEDAGTNVDDMAAVFGATRFASCIPPAVGGSGNPSATTARGVVVAMEAALEHLGQGAITGKRIAIEGAGNVGTAMIGLLLERGAASIVASDISAERIEAVRAQYDGELVELRLVAPGDHTILAEDCDILAPNGLGGVLNPQTIPGIRARLICGSANNQLADEARDCAAIEARGITLVPDFVCNRMGIVNCANEQYGYPDPDPAIERHLDRDWSNGIYRTVQRVLARAAGDSLTAVESAGRVADELATHPHPIWPGRSQQIIETLVRSDWASHTRVRD